MANEIRIGETDALVIVDVQNDFTYPDGKLFIRGVPGDPSIDIMIENIRLLAGLPHLRFTFTLEDLHEDGHVEFSRHGEHGLAGTTGQLYVHPLMPIYQKANMRLVKGDNIRIFSYSVGTCSDFLRHIVMLRLMGILRIFVVGLAYNFCVGETAIDYSRQGFETFVVRDATRSVPPPNGDPESMKRKLVEYKVKEILMRDISTI